MRTSLFLTDIRLLAHSIVLFVWAPLSLLAKEPSGVAPGIFARQPRTHMAAHHGGDRTLYALMRDTFFSGPMGPDWTAFYALFANEAKNPLTREEVLFVPIPSREETRPLVASLLALIKHGLPTPAGPMWNTGSRSIEW